MFNEHYKVDDEWSAAIPGTGGSSFVAKERSGLYTSDECFKMALTDAISVACKALGFAADIYWEADASKYTARAGGREGASNNTQTTKQVPVAGNPADIVLDFGKHKGEKLGDVPAGYARWLAANARDDWLREAAEKVAAAHEAKKKAKETKSTKQPQKELATDEQVGEIGYLLAELEATDEEIVQIKEKFGIKKWNDLTAQHADKLKAVLEGRLRKLGKVG